MRVKFVADGWPYRWHPSATMFPEYSKAGDSVELTETLRVLNWLSGERSLFDLDADEQHARFGRHIFTVMEDDNTESFKYE